MDVDRIGAALTREGNRRFEGALERTVSGDALLRLLVNYVYFNATFGAGVANLAGELGAQKGLFRSADEPIWFLADRSMDVASDIFFAAVDEFDDRSTPHRDPHRALASATIKGMATFLGIDAQDLAERGWIEGATLVAAEEARRGYAIGQEVDEVVLFRALGFHLGSELLADGEFQILDRALSERWPDLRTYLLQAQVEIDGALHNAYRWIQIHTQVEADHFDHALGAVRRALRFYAGNRDLTQVEEDILAGVRRFEAVQTAFMAGLTRSRSGTEED